jgi:hypothetical protein
VSVAGVRSSRGDPASPASGSLVVIDIISHLPHPKVATAETAIGGTSSHRTAGGSRASHDLSVGEH